MFYNISTKPGSSEGAILIRNNYKVIVLYKGSCETQNNGIFIKRVIYIYMQNVTIKVINKYLLKL